MLKWFPSSQFRPRNGFPIAFGVTEVFCYQVGKLTLLCLNRTSVLDNNTLFQTIKVRSLPLCVDITISITYNLLTSFMIL